MEHYDKEFEKYLGEFQPRRPRALPQPAIHRQIWLRRVAAAAAMAVALGASLLSMWKKSELSGRELAGRSTVGIPETKTSPQPLSLLALTQLALEAPQQLDAELMKVSRTVLPDFRGSDSTLRVLAKE